MNKILCIVPYTGLKAKLENSFQKLKKQYPNLNVELYIFIANLANKNELLQILQHNKADIILSRGSTVDFLKKHTNVQIIDIGISQYDIIRTLKTIPNLKKTALVCYPAFSKLISKTFDQFNIKIEKYVVNKKIDIRKNMEFLSNRGFKNIICDSGIIANDDESALDSYVIESGDEIVYQSLKNCFLILQEKQKNSNYYELLIEILNAFHNYTLFFAKNSYSKIIFSSNKKRASFIAKKVRKAIKENNQIINFDQSNWHLIIKQTEKYNIVTLDKLSLPNDNNQDQQIDTDYISSIYAICYDAHFFNLLNYYSKLPSPICLVGTPGLEVQYLIKLISKNRKQNYINIQIKNLNELQKLTAADNSPFFENNQLLVISGIEKLRNSEQKRLFDFIQKSNLNKRNKLVFLIEQSYGIKIKIEFPQFLQIKEIVLSPLNKASYDTFNLLVHSIFNHFSLKTGKTFTGISNTALDQLTSYSWPNNYKEFIQVLTTALEISSGPILKGKDITNILQHFETIEKSQPNEKDNFSIPNTVIHKGETLHDMIIEDIKQTLINNNGNKTQTAKQLDISRATLWRYLKS